MELLLCDGHQKEVLVKWHKGLDHDLVLTTEVV